MSAAVLSGQLEQPGGRLDIVDSMDGLKGVLQLPDQVHESLCFSASAGIRVAWVTLDVAAADVVDNSGLLACYSGS